MCPTKLIAKLGKLAFCTCVDDYVLLVCIPHHLTRGEGVMVKVIQDIDFKVRQINQPTLIIQE